MAVKHRDINGRDIKLGDYVAYAALWDRSATLKYGIVVKLKERKSKWDDEKDAEPTVGVVSVDRHTDWGFDDNGKRWSKVKWEIQAKGKEITLSFLDRMLVVDATNVPDPVRRLLDEHAPRR